MVTRLLFAFLLLTATLASANNIRITNATLVDRNVTAGLNHPSNFAFIQFDLAWDNSWRATSEPSNWDAAWIFIKYRVDGGGSCQTTGWQHATLSTTSANHSITTPNGASVAVVATDGKGVFVQRTANGGGNLNLQGVRLRWNYGADGVYDDCQITIRVLGIEMVYVPQGAFYAGDGMTVPDRAQFSAGSTTAPFQITSEASLTLGGTATTNLGNSNRNRQSFPTDDFDNSTTRTLPAAFPKGFAAFYAMKYELSQEMYVLFLNSLTAAQQLARTNATTAGRFMGETAGGDVAPVGRNGIVCRIAPVGVTPGLYANDLNNNGTYNETDDGQTLACNYLSYADAAAFADWAGMRFLTELEFEKACRGTNFPVPSEFVWGSTSIFTSAYTLNAATSGRATEVMSNASTTVGNSINGQSLATWPEAYRCGMFGTATSTRLTAGATYYGVMDMGSNLAEYFVGLGSNSVRTYTNIHGDGSLLANGNSNVNFWPGVNGSSNRGDATAAWDGNASGGVSAAPGIGLKHTIDRLHTRTSDRNRSNYSANARTAFSGFRGVRTAP